MEEIYSVSNDGRHPYEDMPEQQEDKPSGSSHRCLIACFPVPMHAISCRFLWEGRL